MWVIISHFSNARLLSKSGYVKAAAFTLDPSVSLSKTSSRPCLELICSIAPSGFSMIENKMLVLDDRMNEWMNELNDLKSSLCSSSDFVYHLQVDRITGLIRESASCRKVDGNVTLTFLFARFGLFLCCCCFHSLKHILKYLLKVLETFYKPFQLCSRALLHVCSFCSPPFILKPFFLHIYKQAYTCTQNNTRRQETQKNNSEKVVLCCRFYTCDHNIFSGHMLWTHTRIV